ncbi:dna polymerase i [Lasius niger]|uniref:DNA-directed DNA polymerase n=1 Tax=Lasius niger TaxID=67767 RepID=A0A0J7KD97_LASNI|nr:dna polymerase i [Lasius niger]
MNLSSLDDFDKAGEKAEDVKKLLLIDASGFIFRAFFAFPPLNAPDGTPVNAVYGFCNMLLRTLKKHPDWAIGVVFDSSRKTFRSEIYSEYKAHRPPAPEDLIPQFALIREASEAFGLPPIELEGWEADDLMASYAKEALKNGQPCKLISSDKDLMQLVRPGVELEDPMKQRIVGIPEVEKKFGVPPNLVTAAQSLIGDSTDNVPGVPGIGPKNAAQLIHEYGGLEEILAAAPEMKKSKRRDNLIEFAEQARISLKLVTLDEDAPLPVPISGLKHAEIKSEKLQAWLDRLGFTSLISKLCTGSVSSPNRAQSAVTKKEIPVENVEDEAEAEWGNYQLIEKEAQLLTLIEKIKISGKVGLWGQPLFQDRFIAGIGGIALAPEKGEAALILFPSEGEEVGDLLAEAPEMPLLPKEKILSLLNPIFTDHSILKIFYDRKEQNRLLKKAGFEVIEPSADVQLISYVQSMGEFSHKLEKMTERDLQKELSDYGDKADRQRQKRSLLEIKPEEALAYCGMRADAILRLWYILQPALRGKKALSFYEETDLPLSKVLEIVEDRGILVDKMELAKISKELTERMEVLSGKVFEAAGRSFTLGSPKQLGEVLFDELGLPAPKKTKTGAWSTDASILEELSDKGYAICSHILEWRQLDKLKNTYADALPKEINPETGRVHTNYQIALTSTGRFSSIAPNLQNIPIRSAEGARIRSAFIAPKGRKLISADYSQIELRLMAIVAEVEPLLEAFRLGQDIHARTASEVFNLPLEGMDPLVRRQAKAINFGIIYGISAFGLARQLQISNGEAKKYIEAYFTRYPGILDYMESTKDFAKEHAYVLTPFGRKCHIPEIQAKGPRRAGAERQAINAPLQGGAAEIMRRAMIAVEKRLSKSGLDGKMILQVHDELLFEASDADAEKVAQIAKEEMENVVNLPVKLEVETGIAQNWAAAH